ncbi:hypothetical protein AC249_AIPGENE27119 [Exaiptasia diaphana]|nr:hypothetical protein AC249_AIPGENE27119 [Exaiptasia diaphana]
MGIQAKGGFSVKGWMSNKPIDKDQDGREKKSMFYAEQEKVLGINWNSKTDKLSLKIKPDLLKTSSTELELIKDVKLTKTTITVQLQAAGFMH